ncbi:MAG: TonB-dependent receptor plug domain-containing protein [Bacteroidales bacterium]
MLLITAFAFVNTTAQNISFPDTLKIKEIMVSAKISDNISGAYHQTLIDSAVLCEKRLLKLSDLISESVPLFIKNYGPGSVSSISLRGTGAVHTRVSWNGIIINSPMLGQTDLAIIPAGFIDEVTVDYGSRSMFTEGGAFGGLINITTKPDWNRGVRISASAGTGSFGLWSGSIKAQTGNNSFQSVSRIIFNSAINNFKYLNEVSYPTPVYEYRTNAASNMKGFMHELFFKGHDYSTSVSVWAQSSHRNIPSNILVTGAPSGEFQIDEFARTLFSHSKYLKKSTINLVSGIFYERLDYHNKQASINSENSSVTFTGKASWESVFMESFKIKLSLSEKFDIVSSVNYKDQKIRNVMEITAVARKELFENTGLTILLNETLSDNKPLLPDYSAGIEYYLNDNRSAWIKANYSKNTRLPTLNDMYWNPGGNPDIGNEMCHSGEVNTGIQRKINLSADFKGEFSAYSMRVRDMIQWMPGEHGYWTPVNMGVVNVKGIEANFQLKYQAGIFKVGLSGHYSYTSSVYNSGSENINGNNLIYVPANKAGGVLRAEYSYFYTTVGLSYTGRRYVTVDNSSFLKGYFVTNPEAGINIPCKKNKIGLKFRIENVFNSCYEVIAYYPMPGRWFMFSLNYSYGR